MKFKKISYVLHNQILHSEIRIKVLLIKFSMEMLRLLYISHLVKTLTGQEYDLLPRKKKKKCMYYLTFYHSLKSHWFVFLIFSDTNLENSKTSSPSPPHIWMTQAWKINYRIENIENSPFKIWASSSHRTLDQTFIWI